MKLLPSLLLGSLLAPSVSAQSPNPNPPRLAGFVASTLTPPSSGIRTSVFNAGGACGLDTECRVALKQLPNAPGYAGGAAYDSIRRTLWVTNGVDIASYGDDLNGTCTPFCAPTRLPGLGISEIVTGLAYRDYTQRLYATIVTPATATSAPLHRVAWFDVSGRCTVTPIGSCSLTVPSSISAGGVTYHYVVGGCDVMELFPVAASLSGPIFGSYLLITASLWEQNIPVGATRNYVLVNHIDSEVTTPCTPKCLNASGTGPLFITYPDARINGQIVPLGPITGLAIEAAANIPFGRHRMWASSSNVIVSAVPIIPATSLHPEQDDTPCSLLAEYPTTCVMPHTSRYVGLSVMPGYANSIGTKCTTPACNNCGLTISSAGDPNFGNLAYGVQISGGPPNGIGVLTFGSGPCTPNPMPLCVGEFIPSSIVSAVPFILGNSPLACGGATFVPKISGATIDLGVTVSAQATVSCGTGQISSNCLVWAWQGH